MTKRELGRAVERLQWSPTELAVRLGVQRSAVYHWLAGRRKIPGPVSAAVTCWLEHLEAHRG